MFRKTVFFLLLMSFSAGVMFYGLDGSLRDWDESVYAQVAKENLSQSDWYNLYWNADPWIDKPPLMIWVTRLVYQTFGVGQWQARVGSAFLGWLLIGLVSFWCWRERSFLSGIFAGLVLLGTPHFVKIAKMGQLDVPVAFFLTASLYCFYMGIKGKERLFVLSGIFTALAIMTKWSVGFFSPIIQISMMVFPEHRKIIKNKWWWLGMVLIPVICSPWSIQQYYQHGDVFLNHFLGAKLISSVKDQISGHGGGVCFYLFHMIKKARPWGVIAIFAVLFSVYRSYKKDTFHRFLLVWFVVIFAIFSFANTKLHWYMMPVYPVTSLMIVCWLTQIKKLSNFKKHLILVSVIIVVGHLFFSRGYIKLDLNPKIKSLVVKINSGVADNKKLYVYKDTCSPSLMFYSGKKVILLHNKQDILNRLQKETSIVLVVKEENYPVIEGMLKTNLVTQSKRSLVDGQYKVFFVK